MAIMNMDFSEKFDQARPTQDTITGCLLLKAHDGGNADLIEESSRYLANEKRVVDSHKRKCTSMKHRR